MLTNAKISQHCRYLSGRLGFRVWPDIGKSYYSSATCKMAIKDVKALLDKLRALDEVLAVTLDSAKNPARGQI